MHQRPRRSGALPLAAGQLDAARPDDRLLALRQAGHIRLQDRRLEGRVEATVSIGQAQKHVLAQRLAEEDRRLRHVGTPRRPEPVPSVLHRYAIPAHLSRLQRQRSQQSAQKGALARAYLTGDDG